MLALLGRVLLGSWLAPGAFFSLYWVVALGTPILLAQGDRVPVVAQLWVAAAALAVWVGGYLGADARETRVTPDGERAVPLLGARVRRALAIGAIACAVVGLAAPLVPLMTQGYGLGVFTSPTLLVRAAVNLSVGRYAGTYAPPLLGQLALPFLYLAPALGGGLAALGCRGVRRLATVVPFVPPLLLTVTQTQRAPTIGAAVLWVSSYFAARALLGRFGVFERRHVLAGGLAALLVVALSFVALVARIGATGLSAAADVLPNVVGSLFGHATAFAQWFATGGPGVAPPSWGALTFSGPYHALQVARRTAQLFPDSVVLASGDYTNIYTVFRLLIADFTMPGALVVLTAIGVVWGAAFRAVRKGYVQAVPVLAGCYAFALFSMLTSILVYNTILLALFMFAAAALAYGRLARGTGLVGVREQA